MEAFFFKYNLFFIFLIIASLVSFLLLSLSVVLSFKFSQLNNEIGSQYECGFIPFSDSRLKFDVQFYLISLLFIIFDIETCLLFPYSVVVLEVGFFGFLVILIFFFVLGLGFLLEWESHILKIELS